MKMTKPKVIFKRCLRATFADAPNARVRTIPVLSVKYQMLIRYRGVGETTSPPGHPLSCHCSTFLHLPEYSAGLVDYFDSMCITGSIQFIH